MRCSLVVLVAAGTLFAWRASAGIDPSLFHRAASAEQSLPVLLDRLGERVQKFYEELTSIAVAETIERQELGRDLSPRGRAKLYVFELMVLPRPPSSDSADFRFEESRELRSIDGKAVKKDQRLSCSDPTSAYLDSLLLLLPHNRDRYRFTPGGEGDVGGRRTMIVNFVPVEREPPKVTWAGECFQVDTQTKGKIWIDPATLDVLRLDSSIIGPVVFPGPGALATIERSYSLRLDRFDLSIRFEPVSFEDPIETLLLPRTVETLLVIDGALLPRIRSNHVFGGYRRFRAKGRVVI